MSTLGVDLGTLGQRIRHYRVKAGLTLEVLGHTVGMTASTLSLVENGKREPKLSVLSQLATALGVSVQDILSQEPPTRRAALELELQRAEQNPLFGSMGLPGVRNVKSLADETLESIVGLHRELQRRAREAIATPEEARRANTELRLRMRERNNFLPELEVLAQDLIRVSGHRSGALTHREVSVMAEHLGFSIIYVNDLPSSTRSVTDLEHGRIYIPPASIPGGHGLRAMALQAMAHRLLEHQRPASYAEFLWQRLEINYFSSAVLMPLDASVEFLTEAKRERRLAVEDFRDAFGVTHEAAAMRFSNLATSQLDMTMHFLRVKGDGSLQKVYENDGLPLPADVTGSVEGQLVCKKWSARAAFQQTNRTTENYQYTDTPAGTFWSATQTGHTDEGEFSISIGVPFDQSKWFRGRDTQTRAVSTCPDESCCKRAPRELRERWQESAWPSARMHAHVLSPLPSGSFPGVDDAEVYEFLERHSPAENSPHTAGN